jgi:hypothetical protein
MCDQVRKKHYYRTSDRDVEFEMGGLVECRDFDEATELIRVTSFSTHAQRNFYVV